MKLIQGALAFTLQTDAVTQSRESVPKSSSCLRFFLTLPRQNSDWQSEKYLKTVWLQNTKQKSLFCHTSKYVTPQEGRELGIHVTVLALTMGGSSVLDTVTYSGFLNKLLLKNAHPESKARSG